MNVQEALQELSNAGITNSEQMLRRWIRQRKITAVLQSKKDGYIVDKDSLQAFIKNKVTSNNKNYRTKQLEEENERLKKEVQKLKKESKVKKEEYQKAQQSLFETKNQILSLQSKLSKLEGNSISDWYENIKVTSNKNADTDSDQ